MDTREVLSPTDVRIDKRHPISRRNPPILTFLMRATPTTQGWPGCRSGRGSAMRNQTTTNRPLCASISAESFSSNHSTSSATGLRPGPASRLPLTGRLVILRRIFYGTLSTATPDRCFRRVIAAPMFPISDALTWPVDDDPIHMQSPEE
jgi:hypothetical protein